MELVSYIHFIPVTGGGQSSDWQNSVAAQGQESDLRGEKIASDNDYSLAQVLKV